MSQSRLRKRPAVNYLDDLRLPRVRRTKIKAASLDRLYPLRVVDEDEVRQLVKVRYEGYSTSYDEWRAKDDIVDLHSGDETGHGDGSEDTPEVGSLISPFNLYRELVVGIKVSLTSGRKKSPQIRLRMPFDRLIFTVAEKDTAAAAKAAVGRPKAAVGRQRAAHRLRLAAAAQPRPPICLKIDSLAYDWLTIIPHACARGQFVGLSSSSSARYA